MFHNLSMVMVSEYLYSTWMREIPVESSLWTKPLCNSILKGCILLPAKM